MSFKLYTYPRNYRAYKALIAAAYNGISVEVPDFKLPEDNHTEEFLAKNPLGKVPTMDTPHGPLFESNAIARYVARLRPDTGLYGSTFYESGQVDQWIDFTLHEVEGPRMIWLYPILGYMKYDPAAYKDAKADLAKALKILDNHLASRTFLVGNQVTLADIILTTALLDLYTMVFDPEYRAPFVHVNRWFNTLIHQPKVAAVIGKVDFCKTETKAAAAAAAPAGGKKADKSGDAAAAAPKEAAPKKAEAKKSADDEEDASGAADDENLEEDRPKVAPYEVGRIQFETVKRGFMNAKENRPAWWAEFWSTFDHTGCSAWRSDYNYNAENSVRFMTLNLVGGFLQRLDTLRKHALGAVFVHAANPEKAPFNVTGVWIFDTADVQPEMRACDDAEYYTFTKIDTTTEAGRREIEELFGAETYKGDSVIERRLFH